MGFYLEIIRNVFQALDEEGKLRNRIVAFTSATRGEGVSYVVNTIAKELAEQTHKRVLAVDAVGLQNIRVPEPSQIVRHCSETQLDNLLTLPAEAVVKGLVGLRKPTEVKDWHADPEYRAACLKALRWNFDYIIVDCPSLDISSDATLLAPMIDGVSIVVQAGKTRRPQIHRARQTVENVGGKFLGFVLNQRSYSVPNWLYQRL
ncbi:MAG TPA: CpsD/CapB family tyrosine-protein kinase [Pyrinomonadaceae bacterium]